MRIGILSLNQSANDRPSRYVSKSAAEGFIRKLTHERVSKYVIRELKINVTPSSNPERHVAILHSSQVRFAVKTEANVPQINPPSLPTTLNLFYPVRDMSSSAARNFQEIWGCTMDDWQQRIGAI